MWVSGREVGRGERRGKAVSVCESLGSFLLPKAHTKVISAHVWSGGVIGRVLQQNEHGVRKEKKLNKQANQKT